MARVPRKKQAFLIIFFRQHSSFQEIIEDRESAHMQLRYYGKNGKKYFNS